MLAIPMCLLFELGLLFGRLVDKPKEVVSDDEAETPGS
jgi:Sec-independent protein secretion pathway component TatC